MDVVGGRATPGGGPFNTARALARLGVPAAYVGHLSDDEHGRELLAALERDGVNLELVSLGREPTTTATATVDARGIARYDFSFAGTSAPALTRDMLPARFDGRISAIHLGTLGLVFEPIATTLLGLVEREHGARVVVLDPNVRPGIIPDAVYRERLRRVIAMSTIVKASEEDLAWIYDGVDRDTATARMLDGGVRLAVVTLGAAGAVATTHAGLTVAVPAVQVDVVDTIGAGDAFGAALLAWLHDHGALRRDVDLDRAELTAALRFACLAAAITCTRAGANPPTRRELDAAAG